MSNTDSIQSIAKDDPLFPESLKSMNSCPKVLYFRGELWKPGDKCVAVVGSRICSDYGKRAAADICQGLVDAGVTIVSGLTLGIDTIGHETAVENHARTIAVLGTGLDKESFYPKPNLDLSEKIVQNGGCLISEYPQGTRGAKFTFPQRNRIIAGLSMAVVVIEAKEKSGSLITARWAIKLGRKLFAVPGSIYSVNSKGCNNIIKEGAKIVANAGDIAADLGLIAEIKENALPQGATPQECLVLEAISGEALEIDKIIAKTQLAAATVMSTVTMLEIRGVIKCVGGMKYYLSHR